MVGLGGLRVFNDAVVLFVISSRRQKSQKSQSHRIMSSRGRDHWNCSSLTALLRQGPLSMLLRIVSRQHFEYLQERRLQRLSEQPVTVPTP